MYPEITNVTEAEWNDILQLPYTSYRPAESQGLWNLYVDGECVGIYSIAHNILTEAKRLIEGARNNDYGNYWEESGKSAMIASILTGKTITRFDVVKVMVSVKMARESNLHKRDNLLDACGYVSLWNDLEDRRDE